MRNRKLSFAALSKIGGGFTSFRRTSVDGVKGYSYRMERRLTEEEKQVITSYKNTRCGTWYCPAAPELSHDGVFIGDRCFK